ncbi:MAG: nodulation protein NfeD [Pseudomonadota bacterium]
MVTNRQSSLRGLWATLMAAGFVIMLLANLAPTIAQEGGSGRGTILTLDGPVTPASASYLEREIGAASARREEVIILTIDTPGGLVDSMKTIVKSILASETPVVSYVYPQGARSASAGLYIMYGSHVAAMAPFTNTGSATPVEMGGAPGGEQVPAPPAPAPNDGDAPLPATPTDPEVNGSEDETAAPSNPVDISNTASMRGKVIEDSVAYIRGLAEERGRNAEWAEKAVRPPSASVTAREALELGVIEIVAEDIDDLLRQLNGRTVSTAAGEKTLSTQQITLAEAEPSLIEKILGYIADPNVAAILFSLGSVGLIAEIWNPGSIFPGVFGALCLVLAFYSFQVLPANVLFLSLMGIGVILIVLEAFSPSFGVIGLTGLVLFGTGLYFLFPGEFRVSPIVLGATLVGGGSFLATLLIAIAGSRSHGPLIGHEAIRKREGRVDDWTGGEGYVVVDGERWKARSKETLKRGDRIKVQEVDGIILVVKRAEGAGARMSRMLPTLSKPADPRA